jgi:hypothetical protein
MWLLADHVALQEIPVTFCEGIEFSARRANTFYTNKMFRLRSATRLMGLLALRISHGQWGL